MLITLLFGVSSGPQNIWRMKGDEDIYYCPSRESEELLALHENGRIEYLVPMMENISGKHPEYKYIPISGVYTKLYQMIDNQQVKDGMLIDSDVFYSPLLPDIIKAIEDIENNNTN